jgi:uncharacterized spore protein YtfJ
MNGEVNEVMDSVVKESEARSQALQRILSGADSARVFGQPVTSNGYTVIPAAEIASGGGFGSGMGINRVGKRRKGASGRPPASESESTAAMSGVEGDGAETPAVEGAGGGGGGGGGAMGRPVAAIVLGPEGVQVKPVLDFTKLALTALGAFGAAAALSIKMWSKR